MIRFTAPTTWYQNNFNLTRRSRTLAMGERLLSTLYSIPSATWIYVIDFKRSCSAQSAEEIVALPQLPHATEELEQLPAASVFHVAARRAAFEVHESRCSNLQVCCWKYVWVIDQVCSVKMAGYWPHSFFASLWTSTSSRSINMQKKNLANIQPSWPNKLGQ